MENSISSLLERLEDISADNVADLNNWCDDLCNFYNENHRHSYSEITKYITSLDGGIEYMNKIIPILVNIRETIKETQPNIYNNVSKLIDHIQLEIVRIQYTNELINKVTQNKFLELSNQVIGLFDGMNSKLDCLDSLTSKMEVFQQDYLLLDRQMQAIDTKSKQANEQAESAMKNAENAKIKVENAQNESIAILGIFASVVLAFVGGLTFSTSILQNISNASIYKITFVSCGIALVLINIIYMLLRFIIEIKKTDDAPIRYPSYLKKIDLIILAIALMSVLGWLIDFKHISEIIQNRIYN